MDSVDDGDPSSGGGESADDACFRAVRVDECELFATEIESNCCDCGNGRYRIVMTYERK